MNKSVTQQIITKELDARHLSEISQIHIAAFPDSSWTKLGLSVVENYYRWQMEGPHPVVSSVGAFINNECAGFCIGGIFNASTSGFIKKNMLLLAAKTASKPWLFFDSTFTTRWYSGLRLLKRFSKAKKKRAEKPEIKKEIKSFGILALATSPNFQKMGVGKLLMEDAEKTAIALGYSEMDLTVNPKNSNAVKFYENLNWVRNISGDDWKGVMTKNLSA